MTDLPTPEDKRARFRGFRDADHALHLMTQALKSPKPPLWVSREYRAIFMGHMHLPRMRGGR